jgi:hypothetical protein
VADIFNNNNTKPEDDQPNGDTIHTANETTSLLESYVGDGKKYKSPEELAKGYQNADQYINQMQTENEQLRGELDKRLNAEDMVDRIKREHEELQASMKAQENTTPQLDEKALSDLISQTLDQKNTQKVAQDNIQAVDSKMKELFGTDKASEIVQTKSKELNLSVEYLAEVAAKSPDGFYSLLGIGRDKTITPSITASTTNTEAVAKVNSIGAVEADTWNSFESLRRSDPKKYYTPTVQNKLFKARQDKGQAFYS